jgi:hypothetical protein
VRLSSDQGIIINNKALLQAVDSVNRLNEKIANNRNFAAEAPEEINATPKARCAMRPTNVWSMGLLDSPQTAAQTHPGLE